MENSGIRRGETMAISNKTKSIFSVVRERGLVVGHQMQSYDGKDALN
jgi:hypothetical protein